MRYLSEEEIEVRVSATQEARKAYLAWKSARANLILACGGSDARGIIGAIRRKCNERNQQPRQKREFRVHLG